MFPVRARSHSDTHNTHTHTRVHTRHAHTDTHTHARAHMRTYTLTHTHTHMHKCDSTHTHTHWHVYMYVYTLPHMCVHITHTCTHAYSDTHTHTHTTNWYNCTISLTQLRGGEAHLAWPTRDCARSSWGPHSYTCVQVHRQDYRDHTVLPVSLKMMNQLNWPTIKQIYSKDSKTHQAVESMEQPIRFILKNIQHFQSP